MIVYVDKHVSPDRKPPRAVAKCFHGNWNSKSIFEPFGFLTVSVTRERLFFFESSTETLRSNVLRLFCVLATRVDVDAEVTAGHVAGALARSDLGCFPPVMQISKMIGQEELEEAHLHLLALRQEFQQEQRCCGEGSLVELAKKEKDLSLLYGDLRNKIKAIVRDSNSLPSINKDLLLQVARIIQEEERRAEEPGGLPGSWMESWREAVGEGVQVKVESVPLEPKELNVSWLALHLALLGKAIVEDLEGVRNTLRRCYPPSFKVFRAYVSSYHRAVGQHLKKLEQQTTELKDLYALLDWTINGYKRSVNAPTDRWRIYLLKKQKKPNSEQKIWFCQTFSSSF